MLWDAHLECMLLKSRITVIVIYLLIVIIRRIDVLLYASRQKYSIETTTDIGSTDT